MILNMKFVFSLHNVLIVLLTNVWFFDDKQCPSIATSILVSFNKTVRDKKEFEQDK